MTDRERPTLHSAQLGSRRKRVALLRYRGNGKMVQCCSEKLFLFADFELFVRSCFSSVSPPRASPPLALRLVFVQHSSIKAGLRQPSLCPERGFRFG